MPADLNILLVLIRFWFIHGDCQRRKRRVLRGEAGSLVVIFHTAKSILHDIVKILMQDQALYFKNSYSEH